MGICSSMAGLCPASLEDCRVPLLFCFLFPTPSNRDPCLLVKYTVCKARMPLDPVTLTYKYGPLPVPTTANPTGLLPVQFLLLVEEIGCTKEDQQTLGLTLGTHWGTAFAPDIAFNGQELLNEIQHHYWTQQRTAPSPVHPHSMISILRLRLTLFSGQQASQLPLHSLLGRHHDRGLLE